MKNGKIDLSQSISAGLLVWLGFLMGLVSLEYSVPLSILLGFFGGTSAVWVSTGLKSKEEFMEDTKVDMQDFELSSRQRIRLKEAQQQRVMKPIKTSKHSSGLAQYLFGKNRS